ncbi:hypothetical protein [Amycolatopsis pithecellobii]|uniref:hypothetical protein n=1 Tax=Amycolatopsis pithecellobii TaxID=664692 RepID=UPI001AA02DB2|nr:hypothetical protein [Amycolatopsis pithecellobii]
MFVSLLRVVGERPAQAKQDWGFAVDAVVLAFEVVVEESLRGFDAFFQVEPFLVAIRVDLEVLGARRRS